MGLGVRATRIHAFDGTTGIADRHTPAPRIVLCESGAGIDGYQVITKLRRARRRAMPVMIALKGSGQPEERARPAAGSTLASGRRESCCGDCRQAINRLTTDGGTWIQRSDSRKVMREDFSRLSFERPMDYR